MRLRSIDLLRGVVIIIMALDHIRDYFNADAFLFNPTDLSRTSAALFFTRWITHFCAPVFIFLTGLAAYQVGLRKGREALSAFLFKRGVWLVVLELTVINFAWFYNIKFSFLALTVIWALGVGMIFLAGMIYVPKRILLVLSLFAILLHNLMDVVHTESGTNFGWALLHKQDLFHFGPEAVFTGYGLIPWLFVMSLGYCVGELYETGFDEVRRKKILLWSGFGSIALFIIIRMINVYGDPSPWSSQPTALFSVLSFFNATKYPPSLLYLLMMLGPALVFLAVSEKAEGPWVETVLVFGRTPMFFYVLHLYVLHTAAVIAALATGFSVSDMVFNTWVTDSPNLRGYGFGLPVVYLIWIVVIALLYPLCKWFDGYKQGHREKWWLSYL